jgi:hypothetical protein
LFQISVVVICPFGIGIIVLSFLSPLLFQRFSFHILLSVKQSIRT